MIVMSKRIICTSKQHILVYEDKNQYRLTSEFIDQYCSNHEQVVRKNAWKAEGFGAKFRNDMPGLSAEQIEKLYNTGSITGIAPLNDNEIIFSVMVGDSSGLFKRIIEKTEKHDEGHILHDKGKIFQDIAINNNDQMAFSIRYHNGEQNIAISEINSPHFKELTEGESLDRNPYWHPDNSDIFVYDSAPIGYTHNGIPVIGPRSIMKMDLETYEVDDIIEDHNHDYMNPQIDSDGNLWCIRRPYKSVHKSTSIVDVFLIPFKIAKAIFEAINSFTVNNTGEPLITSGANPSKMKQAPEELFFEGKSINAQLNMEKNAKSGDNFPGFIPKNWELIRITQDMDITVHAKGVCSFCLVSNDEFVFSNGKFLFESKKGKTSKIAEAYMPTKIVVLN